MTRKQIEKTIRWHCEKIEELVCLLDAMKIKKTAKKGDFISAKKCRAMQNKKEKA